MSDPISIHFGAWLAGNSQGARLAKQLIEMSEKPDMARAILEIGFVEGCVYGAESVGRRVQANLQQAGHA